MLLVPSLEVGINHIIHLAELDGGHQLENTFLLMAIRFFEIRATCHLVYHLVSAYSSSHFWRIRIFRISSFMLRRYGLRFAYEKKKCSVSIDTLQLNTTPLFSHLLNTSLSIYTLLRSHSWLIWSKQPLMSPSSIHCGKQSLLNHLWSASIASAVLLNFLNPYEFASASLSVISSKAIRYILHGSVLHGWYSQRSCLAICFGYVDLPQREGLISSPFQ